MSLQMILGSSGAGKSHHIYETIIQASIENPQKEYLILVPEQFTMQTQKTLAEMHPGGGILNIDILSFERLAYRIFEEVGGDNRKLLEETGKSLVLQKIVQEQKDNLKYLGSQIRKPGCIDQLKSMLSELMQYDVDPEKMEQIVQNSEGKPLLYRKMQDMQILYLAFQDFLKDHYMTGEEVLDVLCDTIEKSKKITGSTIVLDGYTGFTPIQNRLLGKLLELCEKVYITVTLDPRENPLTLGSPYALFYMSKKMIYKTLELARAAHCPIEEFCWIKSHRSPRFAAAPSLHFLEKNLLRFRQESSPSPQQEIQICAAGNPRQEMEEAARRILSLVREEGYHYGDISIITGDLQEYAGTARQVLEKAGIPIFLDEKHSVLMNPFVEYLRSAMNMPVENYSYESVFRYLRCGMSSFTREEIDKLENYVIALGIRGKKKWTETWTRVYRGMKPEDIQELNQLRQRFAEEITPLMELFSGREKTVEEYTRGLYDFILQGKIQEKLFLQEQQFHQEGNLAMEKEYHQIYKIVMNLFDRMVEILGKERIRRQEYQQILETGLSETKVALIPPSMDEVLIGDIERTRLKGVKALFLVGVNDGKIPKNTEKGGFLGELDREFLAEKGTELAPGARELTAQQRFYLYLNMTKPSGRLYLSYSKSNARGEPLNSAYLISAVQKIFPSLSVCHIEEGAALLDQLQHPAGSLEYFLRGLKADGEKDPVWRELYSWYLRDEQYRDTVEKLVDAAFFANPKDKLSESVAKALYGEISEYGATRLEKYAACAFAHFLQYGLRLTERAEYEFKAMDMGNVIHMALETFAKELRSDGKKWRDLTEEEMEQYVDSALLKITGDYGNTILHSTSRNEFLITRVRGMLRRTVWALVQQLKNGVFEPEGFEVALAGGRIDRIDVCETDEKVYVKIIDYKTGNTAFDLVALYHGLQLQLVVYLNGALEAEASRHPGKEIVPAGIFYYNVKDPMILTEIQEDLDSVEEKLLKELKMKGLVQSEDRAAYLMDSTLATLPVSVKSNGEFKKSPYLADRAHFELLSSYVKKKIETVRAEITKGNTAVNPYQLGKEKACTWCPYASVCGFDQKIPGYEFRHLSQFSDSGQDVWESMRAEVEKE